MMRAAILMLLALGILPAHADFVRFRLVPHGRTEPLSINDAGTIVGNYSKIKHGGGAFLRAPDGTITTFAVPGHGGTVATAINNSGTVTGYYISRQARCFTRAADGTITLFDAPHRAMAMAIDDLGDIAGNVLRKSGPQGFVLTADGGLDVFKLGGASGVSTFVTGLNASRLAVGYWFDTNSVSHGFLRDAAGTVTPLDIASAGTGYGQGTIVKAVNADGDATGYFIDNASISHGFLRLADGTIVTFDVPGFQGTQAVALNADREVGGVYFEIGGYTHGFVRKADGSMKTFDTSEIARHTLVTSIAGDGTLTGSGVNENSNWFGFAGKSH